MIAAQAIGLFSKESAAILPAILLLYDLSWSDRASWRARAPAYAALALPFAGGVVGEARRHLDRHEPIGARALFAPDVGFLIDRVNPGIRHRGSGGIDYRAVVHGCWRLRKQGHRNQ